MPLSSVLPPPGEVRRLDGGLATWLESRGHDLAGPLWSARLLLEAPEEIRAAHRAFLDAGAEVVLSAGYQLSGPGLARAGLPPERADALTARAIRLAREAIADAGVAAWVAASLGPYGALLADGSEYRGRYDVSPGRLRDVHAPRIAAAAAAGPDLLALETVPSGAEVTVLVDLLDAAGVPAWISMTAGPDGRTPEGEPLEEALGPALAHHAVIAVGVNCVPPEHVAPALERLAGAATPRLVKPNLGARWEPSGQRWRRTPLPDPAPWVRAGARLVGGCCGTSAFALRGLLGRLPA